MAARLTADSAATKRRSEALDRYLTANVDDGCRLLCTSAAACRGSMRAGERFVEGQLSHVGLSYDLRINDRPLRIAVVSKQVGGSLEHGGERGDEHVSMSCRSAQVESAKAGRSPHPRTNHMVGNELAMKVLLRGTLDGEPYLKVEGLGVLHVFDSMALLNATLCSRVGSNASGQGSSVMFSECSRHLSESLRLLEPTVVLAQGWTKSSVAGKEPSVASMVASALGQRVAATDPACTPITAPWGPVALVTAYHPSRHWAAPAMPYWSRLLPALLSARHHALGEG